MDDNDVLAQIEKKREEISNSNQELAQRMDRNKEVISKFSDELEILRKDMSNQGVDSKAKQSLDKLKTELEDKKELISSLLEDLKPLEIDVARRESLTDALQQKINDQNSKIEVLSRDLMSNKKKLEQFMASDVDFRKKITEKDTIIQVIKEKLNEKTALTRDLDQKNSKLEQDVDVFRKQVFALENKVAAVEKRVHSTNDQNQKLLYELMQYKEKAKSNDSLLDGRDRLIASKDAEHARSIAELRASEENKRIIIMKDHTKKLAIMNATISTLKARLEKQQELIDLKSQKERNLMVEFSRGMKELMSQKVDTNLDLSKIEAIKNLPGLDDSVINKMEDSSSADMLHIPPPEEDDDSHSATYSGLSGSGAKIKSTYPTEPRTEEIIPIIEIAMDHGDDADTIRHSLHSSGYSQKDVQEAFERLNVP